MTHTWWVGPAIAGRPGLPERDSFDQYSRNFRRRHAMTIASRQPDQEQENQTQRSRSAWRSRGRFDP